MNEKITGKQDAFVKAYILNPNAKQAAIAAGYSEKTAEQQGCRLLRNVKVMEAIKEHQLKCESEFICSKNDKLKILENIMDSCKEPDPRNGVINATAVISAIKEHNAMMGHNAPTESTATIKVKRSLAERLTNESTSTIKVEKSIAERLANASKR
jgi:phage terminase small subunit